MKITILESRRNELLEREDIKAVAFHEGEPTPSNENVRAEVARIRKVDPDRVLIKHIYSKFGSGSSEIIAKIYDKAEVVPQPKVTKKEKEETPEKPTTELPQQPPKETPETPEPSQKRSEEAK